MGWILSDAHAETRTEAIRDFARFPELRFLNRFHLLPPFLLAVAIFLIGGFPLLVWGFFVSTVVLWHGTFTINSLAHVFGRRRYKTTDTSRNNFLLALITCGEGWHNNHHYHQNTANQGWFWWEVDATTTRCGSSGAGADLGAPDPTEAVRFSFQRYTDEDRAALRNAPLVLGKARLAVLAARERMAGTVKAAGELAGAAPAPALRRR